MSSAFLADLVARARALPVPVIMKQPALYVFLACAVSALFLDYTFHASVEPFTWMTYQGRPLQCYHYVTKSWMMNSVCFFMGVLLFVEETYGEVFRFAYLIPFLIQMWLVACFAYQVDEKCRKFR